MTSAEKDDHIHAFTQRLLALSAAEDRGALASLRRSLQDPSGMAASACPFVVPFLPKAEDVYRDRCFFLVGALFALGGGHARGVSIGEVYRRIALASGSDGKENPSIRARFVALIDAHAEDAGEHVRHAASLARAKDIPIDWELLLRDLLRLRHPERFVQRRWAHDFWGRDTAAPTTDSESTAAPAASTTEVNP